MPILRRASLTAAEVFARFRVLEPAQGEVYLQIGGYIHKAPWYLPKGRFPEDKGTTFLQVSGVVG